MRGYLSKILYITGEKTRALPWMLALYFVSLGLELLGLSLIIPFIALLQDPARLDEYALWRDLTAFAGLRGASAELMFLSGGIFTVYLLKTLLNIKIQSSILRFSYDLQHHLRVKFSGLFLSGPYLFHTKRRSDEIINMMQSHISQFSKGVVGSLLRMTGEVLTLIAVFGFLLVACPVPTLTAFTVLGAFGFIYDRTVRRQIKRAGQDLIDANRDQLKSVRQGIRSLKEARILGCGDFFHEDIARASLRAANVNALVAVLQTAPRYILEFLIVAIVILSSMALLATGNAGSAVIDALAVFAVAATRLLPVSNQILSNITSMRYAHQSMEELYADLKELERPHAPEGFRALPSDYRTLSLHGVSFTYPGHDAPALSSINLDLKKGEIVGLSGESGAGKSTLVDLILGLIEPACGEIRLNGAAVELTDWAHHSLAAYIPQKPAMLDDTVAANVALGQTRLDRARVEDALCKARLLEFVQSLPEGIDTVAGEDAVLFSGGQCQRMALARAFYFDRPLIILDEATSALDRETESGILTALQDLRKDATILIITHSPQPLQICDRVCYLSGGRIIKEEGLKQVS